MEASVGVRFEGCDEGEQKKEGRLVPCRPWEKLTPSKDVCDSEKSPSATFLSLGGLGDLSCSSPTSPSNEVRREVLAVVGAVLESSVSRICELSAIKSTKSKQRKVEEMENRVSAVPSAIESKLQDYEARCCTIPSSREALASSYRPTEALSRPDPLFGSTCSAGRLPLHEISRDVRFAGVSRLKAERQESERWGRRQGRARKLRPAKARRSGGARSSKGEQERLPALYGYPESWMQQPTEQMVSQVTCLTPPFLGERDWNWPVKGGKRNRRISRGSLSFSPPLHLVSTTTTMSSLAAFGTKTVARGVGRFTDLVLEKGSGAYITTDTGRQMMDFTSGIGVTNLGRLFFCSGTASVGLQDCSLPQQATATPR